LDGSTVTDEEWAQTIRLVVEFLRAQNKILLRIKTFVRTDRAGNLLFFEISCPFFLIENETQINGVTTGQRDGGIAH
jgi:hypothetical protein